MNCPNKETMQDFVDGELEEAQDEQIIEHVRSCKTCKMELQEILTLYDALSQVVDSDQCPSLEVLKSYTDNTCHKEQASKIKEHVDFCGRCGLYVWSFLASGEDFKEWQAQEDLAFDEHEAYEAAKETLLKLLPKKIELLDNVWQSMLAFVLDLKGKAIENWPSFDTGAHLVGVLGFEESYDPEAEAASIIMATTLYVSQATSDGQIKPCRENVEISIKEVAIKLGAGKELQKRLIETVPPIVLKFKSELDA
jgi:hypothetical protein